MEQRRQERKLVAQSRTLPPPDLEGIAGTFDVNANRRGSGWTRPCGRVSNGS